VSKPLAFAGNSRPRRLNNQPTWTRTGLRHCRACAAPPSAMAAWSQSMNVVETAAVKACSSQGRVIEALWLVNGGHGASFGRHNEQYLQLAQVDAAHRVGVVALQGGDAEHLRSKRRVIEARWVSKLLAFAGNLRPRRLNNQPF
jgi:hypothetical protein